MFITYFGGVARAIIAAGFAYAAAKGWIPAGDYSAVVTGIVTTAVAIWSVRAKSKLQK